MLTIYCIYRAQLSVTRLPEARATCQRRTFCASAISEAQLRQLELSQKLTPENGKARSSGRRKGTHVSSLFIVGDSSGSP